MASRGDDFDVHLLLTVVTVLPGDDERHDPHRIVRYANFELPDLRIGDIPVSDPDFGARYRSRYARSEGQTVPLVVKRDGADRTLTMPVRSRLRTVETIVTDRNASPKAMRIRSGILKGTP